MSDEESEQFEHIGFLAINKDDFVGIKAIKIQITNIDGCLMWFEVAVDCNVPGYPEKQVVYNAFECNDMAIAQEAMAYILAHRKNEITLQQMHAQLLDLSKANRPLYEKMLQKSGEMKLALAKNFSKNSEKSCAKSEEDDQGKDNSPPIVTCDKKQDKSK